MNFETDNLPIHDAPFATRQPIRRRRVRHSYPASLVHLVGYLRTRAPARDISAALDIPLSSVYRWAPIWDSSSEVAAVQSTPEHWKALVSRCKADGIEIPRSVTDEWVSRPARRTPESVAKRDQCAASAKGRLLDCNASRNVPRETKGQAHLEAARSLIEREYFRDIDSKILAAATGLSRFRFIHAFTAAYNISPHQYLLRIRIAAAKKLVATSRETVDVIAAATGFRSGACLNRAFTRVEGQCISRFHRMIANKP